MRGTVGRGGPGEWYETVLYGLEGGGERCEWKDGRWDIMNSRNRGGSWWQQLVRSLEGLGEARTVVRGCDHYRLRITSRGRS